MDSRIPVREKNDRWTYKDGFKTVIRSETVFEDLGKITGLTDSQYNSFTAVLERHIPGLNIKNADKKDVSNIVFERIKVWSESVRKSPATGEIKNDPLEWVNYEIRKLFVFLYEERNPDDASKMDDIANQFEKAGYEGWDKHVTNIKYLVYTAFEPYKTLFIQNASEFRFLNFDYRGRSQYNKWKRGILINHVRMGEKADTYNTFFHECFHNIDHILGKRYEKKEGKTRAGKYFTEYYTFYGKKLNDAVFEEVDKRVDSKIREFEETKNKKLDESQTARLKNCFYNMIDYHLFGPPHVGDDTTKAAYDYILDEINREVKGTANDMYGAITGNTFANAEEIHKVDFANIPEEEIKREGRYHPATVDLFGIEDKKGNIKAYYRFYWVKSKRINEKNGSRIYVKLDNGKRVYSQIVLSDYNCNPFDRTGEFKAIRGKDGENFAQKIIDADGNIVRSSFVGMEFFAENCAYNLTREVGDEHYVKNYYYRETIEFFEKMISYCIDLQ